MQQTQVKSEAASIIEGRITGKANPVSSSPKKQYIVRETPIKAMSAGGVERIFHIKRDRVLLTPSMCTAEGCNYDASVAAKYPEGWDTVPERFRDGILQTLEEHRAYAHTVSSAWIISEDEVPRSWLGEKRG